MAENGNSNSSGLSRTTRWVMGLFMSLMLAGNAILFSYASKAHAEISRVKETRVTYRDLDLIRKDLERFKHEIRTDIKANTKAVNEVKGMLRGMR